MKRPLINSTAIFDHIFFLSNKQQKIHSQPLDDTFLKERKAEMKSSFLCGTFINVVAFFTGCHDLRKDVLIWERTYSIALNLCLQTRKTA